MNRKFEYWFWSLPIAIPIFVILILPFLLIFGSGLWLSSATCHNRWAGTYQTEWGPLSGCRVNINDKWVPEDRVREY